MLICAFLYTLFRSRRGAIEQRLLLDSVLNSVDAHVYLKDRDRRYLYINAKTAEPMGLPTKEVVGKLDREVFPQEKADAYWEQDKQIFIDGQRQGGRMVEFPRSTAKCASAGTTQAALLVARLSTQLELLRQHIEQEVALPQQ